MLFFDFVKLRKKTKETVRKYSIWNHSFSH